MLRTRVTANQLQRLIDLELAQRQPRACRHGCQAPVPFWRAPPKPGCSNWQLALAPCARGCDTLMRNIREGLKVRYDLSVPAV